MKIRAAILIAVMMLLLAAPGVALSADKWQGTDDLLDSHIQNTTGVEARKPLIDISQGNLGLFLFTLGGFAAGTVIGYQWRKLFKEKAGVQND